jgi:hypothetical protein
MPPLRHAKRDHHYWRHGLVTLLGLMLMACSGAGPGLDSQNSPPAQGSRILGLDVKDVPTVVTYTEAYDQAVALGVREVSVALDWAAFEPTMGNYVDYLNTLAAIEGFYPDQAADLTLVLRPLDTAGPSLPADLAGLPFDDAAVRSAFAAFLSHLHDQLPNLNASGVLKWIQVGNEIDASLGRDSAQWTAWQTFFDDAKSNIQKLWGGGVAVSSIIQFGALADAGKRAAYLGLLPSLDNAVFTYYPLNSDFSVRSPTTVAGDFDVMVTAVGGKDIVLQECGFPSSADTGSSEALQADFVSAVFDAWDDHRERIRLVDFAWQYDVSPALVEQWVGDYGMSGNANEKAFRGYLSSLGLNNVDGSEKPAMQRLRDELQARHWAQ